MKRFVSILTVVCLSLCFALTASAKTISRNETVYVNLDPQGKPRNVEVVTWLKTDGRSPSADWASLDDIRNVKGVTQPAMEGDKLTFDTEDLNIFYRGTTDKALPLAVDIEYKLDGREISFDALEGKTGTLEININLKNTTGTPQKINYTQIGTGIEKTTMETLHVPIIAMVAVNLDIDHFSNFEAPEGVYAVVGNTIKMNWIALPVPEQTIKLVVEGRNIEMPSIMITAFPKWIPLPAKYQDKVDELESKLNQLYDGVDQVGGYLDKLQDGAAQIADGNAQIYDSLVEAEEKSGQMIQAIDAQAKLTEGSIKINDGIREKLAPLTWISSMKKMSRYLKVQSELLTLVVEGGPFSERVLEFFKDQGIEKPEYEEFPASMETLKSGVEASLEKTQKKLPDVKRLKDGSQSLTENIAKVKKQGTEVIKSSIVEENEELVIKLAGLEIAEEMAKDYDRFAGEKSEIPSCVQFIMKTPGKYSH